MTTIYHYCDTAAFVSIIESGKLRLTNAKKTNDRHERDFFKEKAFDYVAKLAKQNKSMDSLHTALHLHFDLVEDLSDFHICCLSEQSDSVGQWVAYADKGAGFAIGFDLNALRMAVGAPMLGKDYEVTPLESAEGNWRFARVIYGEEEGMQPYLKKLADIGAAKARGEHETAQLARDHINQMCAFFKHPAFKEEKEWRITYDATRRQGQVKSHTQANRSEILWRYGKYGLTPYCETPDILSCITEIVIGPRNLDLDAKAFVSEFLKSRSVRAKIETSQSPYR